MQPIWKILFYFNVIWGIIFGITSFVITAQVRSDGDWNCSVSYKNYLQDKKYPDLLGSKSFAFYTVFGFFNPADEPSFESDSFFGCDNNTFFENLITCILFILWATTLFHALFTLNLETRWWIIFPTILSILGIVWWYKFLL